MEKKGKPKRIVKKDRKDDYGNSYYELEFDNGDKGLFSTKSEDQKTFTVNSEITYIIEEKEGKNGKWFKISVPKPAFGGGGKPQQDPKVQMISFSMSYTKDLIVGGKVEMKDLEKVFNQIHSLMVGKL